MIYIEADFRDGVDFNIRQGDNVSGYTIRQIEDCMVGTTTWSQFRQKFYNNYPNNSTRGNLQTLFDAWANYNY